jgi:hypothetical protein
MKIRAHTESHIVELDDGSRWQVFPGDLDLTLAWKPEASVLVSDISRDGRMGRRWFARERPRNRSLQRNW